MGERRESSVLFSLGELRRIEEDRVKQEEAEIQARVDAERRAREDAERRAREQEEARRREAEERAMRERLELERMGREGQIRLQEAEQRARVEAETKLREQQMHLEIQMRSKAPPVKGIVAGVAVLFLIVCGLGYSLYKRNEAEKQALIVQKEQEQRDLQQQLKVEREQQALFKKELDNLEESLKRAKTDAERQQIQDRMNRLREQQRSRTAKAGPTQASPQRPQIKMNDTTDPLEGTR